jgi:F-type H+-transporting ATPase subunit gamma
MKALSAASIRQYELAVHALAEYYRTVERGLYVVLQDFEEPPFPRHRKTEPLRLAAIIFGSDYGLCGRINEDITAYALERIASSPATADGRLLLAVGARIAANLEQLGQSVEEIFLVPGSAARITATVQQILLKVDEWRQTVGIHYVYLFYNRPVSAGGYRPTGVELLPVNLRRFHRLEERTWPSRCLPTYRMERQNLLAALLRQYFFVSIFRACAESQASEHTSRLTAMQTAEKNLDERLAEVTGEYRRVRQDAITAELLDVVSGFEALTSGELSAQ